MAVFNNVALGVNYISSPALDQAMSLKVLNCPTKSTIQLPIITWGGDIATIYANGNQKETSSSSILGKKGLKFSLKREDKFKKQIESYMSCQSPFLRGTLGMVNMASKLLNQDPRTKLRVIYQHTWSQGGDALVVKPGIKSPRQLKGKTIVLQAYGPHIDYLGKVLANAGLGLNDVKLKWVQDLTGTDESPMAAFYNKDIDAAMVIIPDALALTSNGTVGTGSEDSVKGAKILLSTKSANRIVADVYAVREDFYKANKGMLGDLVHGLMLAQEELQQLVQDRNSKKSLYSATIGSSAEILLDSSKAIADTEGLYADAKFVGFPGNKQFFQDPHYPRRFSKLNSEIAETLGSINLTSTKANLEAADWDYDKLSKGIVQTSKAESGKFNQEAVAKIVQKKNRQGNDDDSLFSFEVYFKPNQNTFVASQYEEDFKRVIDLASTYGGAIITIEGHSDPLGYLKKKKNGSSKVVLQRIRQSAKNLSLTRANAVRNSLIQYASKKKISLDPTQFAVVGHGIAKPANGVCGSDPCAPKTKEQWLENMRVEFKIIQVEAEEDVFSPI
ncbi:OmpA family protein [Pseudobacteriovorax antillogorgiicola]|nr:OmpA family protein [Pseudobacteriovorax antillogorgiicola]